MLKKITLLLFFATSTIALLAQVPSPKDFLGYELGTRFTLEYRVIQYFEAVAKASPATMKYETYGYTNAGRPLTLAYISSAENMGNLEAIRLNNLKLTGLLSGQPSLANAKAIVWLSYNVHGNEPSPSEAAMATLYELITAKTTNATEWLKNTVVIIDPCINPDGHDRYVNWLQGIVGQTPNPDPQSREHAEPWPGGRSNYYNFDLNRDWAWQTQVETQQRIKKYNAWMPHIHCDYHEQGYNEPYYFAPAAEPFHEVITTWQRDFQNNIGRNHARYFDANNWLYFTKERFDLFYPSYGDTWPLYNGSIGMTYEQGGHSRGGLAVITEDADTLTLKDRTLHHYTTGISTVEIASLNAQKLVDNFKKYFDDAKTNGVGEYKSFVVKTKGNEDKVKDIILLLNKNQISYAFGTGTNANGYNYFTGKTENFSVEKGDLVISTVQPKGTLAKVLFEPKSKLVDSATYDITAWSVPYAYGALAFAVKEKLPTTQPAANVANEEQLPTSVADTYGYVCQWNSFSHAKFLAQLLAKGIKPRVSTKTFFVNGKTYDRGSIILIKTSNKKITNFSQTVQAIAKSNQIVLDTVATGFMDKGSDFGSPDVATLFAPKVACLTGESTSSLSAGEVWHYFEKEMNYPLTLINANDAGRTDWSRYDVLIVPDGNYRTLFAKDGELKNWIEKGGRLITLENATSQLANAEWGLKLKKEDGEKDKDKDKEKNPYADLKKFGDAERDALTDANPGSIYKVEVDNTHPLAFGYPNFYYTLKQDNNVYEFLKDGWNVGIIKKDNQVAGFTGVKARQKITDGTLFGQMDMGRGSIVFFADDLLFRSFWQNGKLLFANAVFLVGQGNGAFHVKKVAEEVEQ